MKKTVLCLMAALLAVPAIKAQEQTPDPDKPKLKIAPTGRFLLDGALFASPDKEYFKDGVGIPDARIGVKASYGKWSGTVDVGFSNNKVGLKDLIIQYKFDEENLLKGGYFIHQYGLQSSTSSSMKVTFEEPMSNTLFNADRQIGFMYVHSEPQFLATASVHAEPNAIKLSPNETNGQGYGLLSRLVYRPLAEEGRVVQVGISGGFDTPWGTDADSPHDTFTFQSKFPTRVNKEVCMQASVDHAMNMWKFTPELLLNYGPVALEAQYFYNRVNRRHDLHSFTGQGAYATVRGLILGDSYTYDAVAGGLATPRAKSLEFVAGYNYSTLCDRKAGIAGGRVNEVSATMTYYINKFLLARLNYTYTHNWGNPSLVNTDLRAFQARIQIIF